MKTLLAAIGSGMMLFSNAIAQLPALPPTEPFTLQGQAILDKFEHHYWSENDDTEQQPLTIPQAAAANLPEQGAFKLASELPAGEKAFSGVRFNATQSSVRSGSEIQIDANATADRVYFLHTMQPGPAVEAWWRASAIEKRRGERTAEPPVVIKYRISYEDGAELVVPVRFGEAIERWYRVGMAGEMTHAQAVTLRRDPKTWENAVVYLMKWTNPRPDQPIKSIHATAGQDAGEVVLLGVTLARPKSAGKTYFVAPNGDDSAAGSMEKPWATLSKLAELKPGDKLYVRGGTYPLAKPLVLTAKGEANAWITLSAYPGETPVFDAWDFIKDPKLRHDKAAIIDFQSCEFFRVAGLTAIRSPAVGMSFGGTCKYVDCVGNTIYHTRAPGLWMNSDCTFNRAIGNTVIRPNSRDMHFDEKGEKVYHSISPHEGIDANGTYAEFAFNEVYFGDKELMDLKGKNHHVLVHHNYLHNGVAMGIYVDAWNKEGLTDIELGYNTIHDASGAVSLGSEVRQTLSNVRVHHNLGYRLQHNGYSAFGANTSDTMFWNNTAVEVGWGFRSRNWSGGGASITGGKEGSPKNTVFRNNILVDSAQYPISVNDDAKDLAGNGTVIANNLIYPRMDTLGFATRDVRTIVHGDSPVFEPAEFVDPSEFDFRAKPGSIIDQMRLGARPSTVAPHRGFTLGGHVMNEYVTDAEVVAMIDKEMESVASNDVSIQPLPIPGRIFNAYITHKDSPIWLNSGQYMGGPYTLDIRDLPRGRQTLGGTPWYIRDPAAAPGPEVMLLSGGPSGVRNTTAIRGVPVGATAQKIHFLHTFGVGPALSGKAGDAKPEVFRYVVHYEDGSSVTVPIRFREAVGPYMSTTDRPELADAVRVAWEIRTVALTRKTHPAKGGRTINVPAFINTVYAYAWTNPHPDKPVKSIDLEGANADGTDYGAAALFAITLERAK